MTHLKIIEKPIITKKRAVAGMLTVFLVLLILPNLTRAYDTPIVTGLVSQILGWIAHLVVYFEGQLIIKVMHILINYVAPYGNFIGAAGTASGGDHPVALGWVLVRDLSNMFFIVILLVIAFGTMFKIEAYDYKKLLPRLLVMAILINFSRTITGLVIDGAQVIMLTFVNAFQAAAAGNIVSALGIQDSISQASGVAAINLETSVVTFIFAVVFLAITLMVLLIITMTLVVRIVMLWLLTILSPAAFLLSTFPKGQKYYGQWWDKLICWAFSGPVLAFFLWLALATMAAGGGDVANAKNANNIPKESIKNSALTSEAAQEDNIVKFMIGIIMLLAGVQIGQEFCAIGTGMVKSVGNFAKNKAIGAAKYVATKKPGYLAAGILGGGIGAPIAYGLAKAGFKRMDYAGLPKKILGVSTGKAGGFGKGMVTYAYGGIGRLPGMKGVAMAGMAKTQEASTKAYEERAKTATAAATADPKAFASLVASKPIIKNREDGAKRAAEIQAALSNSDVRKNLAPKQKTDLAAEYKELKDNSGNKTIKTGYKDTMSKSVPHLISDPEEKLKAAKGLNASDIPKIDTDALADPDIARNLGGGAKKYFDDKKATPEQQAAYQKGLAGPLSTGVAAEAAKAAATPTAVAVDVSAIPPVELEAKLVANDIDLSAIDPAKITPEAADAIARKGKPEQLASMGADPAIANAFKTALAGFAPPSGTSPSPDEIRVGAAKIIAGGASFGEAFGTTSAAINNLAQAFSSNNAQTKALLKSLGNKGAITGGSADPRVVGAAASSVNIKVLSEMVEGGDSDENKIAIAVARQIKSAGASPTATRDQKDRAVQLTANPVFNRIIGSI